MQIKASSQLLLLLLGAFASTSYAQSSESVTLPFPYGTSVGDTSTRPNDDGSSPPITLPLPMVYFNEVVTQAIQNTNGDVTFDGPYSAFDPSLIPSSRIPPMIAIFWTDIDTRNGGDDKNQLWFGAHREPSDLETAATLVSGTGNTVEFEAVLVATWLRVEAFSRRSDRQNTFQLTVAYNEEETWAILSYEQLQFFMTSTSDFSVVGFNDRPGLLGELIQSIRTEADMTKLQQGTNCGRRGTYAFRISEEVELSGCGVSSLPPTIFPFHGPIEGGAVVQIGNLPQCANDADVDVYCKFEGNGFSVVGLGYRVDQETLECTSPMVNVESTCTVSYAINPIGAEFDPDTATWTSANRLFQFVGTRPGLIRTDEAAGDEGPLLLAGEPFNIAWNNEALMTSALASLNRVGPGSIEMSALSIDVEVVVYNPSTQNFFVIETIPLTPEAAEATVVISEEALTEFSVGDQSPQLSVLTPIAVVLVRVVAKLGNRVGSSRILRNGSTESSLNVATTPSAMLSATCEAVLKPKEECPGIAALPPCPPTQDLAEFDNMFDDDHSCTFPEGAMECDQNWNMDVDLSTATRSLSSSIDESGLSTCSCRFSHAGAAGCYRSAGPGRTRQQCCYTEDGGLITDANEGAGTGDCVGGTGSLANSIDHLLEDILPFIVCCKVNDDCGRYYEERLPSNSDDYFPPFPPGWAAGDPHLQTVDGKAYTFNGAGEYVAFCHTRSGDTTNDCAPSTTRLTSSRNAISVHYRFVPSGRATITKGVAVEDPLHNGGVSGIVIIPHPTRRIDVFDGRSLVAFPETLAGQEMTLAILSSGTKITRSVDLTATQVSVRIQTPSGLVVRVLEQGGVMLPAVSVPPNFPSGQSAGLLGVIDGDDSNDFTDSSGNVQSVAADNTEEIFNRFGSTWMIRSASASLFKGLDGSDQAFSEFYNPSYIPLFVAPTMSSELQAGADEACGEITDAAIRSNCYFDVAITGDVETFAAAARAADAQSAVVATIREEGGFTGSPTMSPTKSPTLSPTISPAPTPSPTKSPTQSPTAFPTKSPTQSPTAFPTTAPTAFPTKSPTQPPTAFPTTAPTVAPTTEQERRPAHCASLKACYLENLDTRQKFRLGPNGVHEYLIGPRYSVRCDIKNGNLYNIVFRSNGSTYKERHWPYYMRGETGIVPNSVTYLEQGCGPKTITAVGRVWAGECFTETFNLEAIC